MNKRFSNGCAGLCLLAAATWAEPAVGAAITVGDLVVVRIGDGSTSISGNAAAVSLLEYTTSGTLVQTINVASTGGSALTLTGNITNEGILQQSSNGQYLLLTGYRKNAGGTNPSADASTTTNRVVGRVTVSSGAVDTSTALTDAYSGVSIRSATSDNGTRFWTAGGPAAGSGGLRYVGALGATTSTDLNGGAANEFRQVSVLGGNLFTSSPMGAPGYTVYQVGSGLPTSGTPTLTSSINPGGTPHYQGFYFTNLGGKNWNSTGFDTLYAVNVNAQTLEKWSFNGTSWVLNNSQSLGFVADVTGTTQGTTVNLFLTVHLTTTGGLYSYTDTSGFNQNANGTFTSLASPGTNYAFRGVAYIRNTPEPGAFILAAAASLAMTFLIRLRRQTV
jgi:hypothetical protein